jgi:hypothetical protein
VSPLVGVQAPTGGAPAIGRTGLAVLAHRRPFFDHQSQRGIDMTKHNRTASAAVKPFLITVPDLHHAADFDAEPTAADLAAIDIESPLIAAEVAVVDAEVAIVCAPRGPSDLDWHRLRRARRQVLREAAALAARPAALTTRRAA